MIKSQLALAIIDRIDNAATLPDDPPAMRLRKTLLVFLNVTAVLVVPFGAWFLGQAGWPKAAFVAFAYVLLSAVSLLLLLFSRFDQLSERYGIEKIKTIGDAYMVCVGVPEIRRDVERPIRIRKPRPTRDQGHRPDRSLDSESQKSCSMSPARQFQNAFAPGAGKSAGNLTRVPAGCSIGGSPTVTSDLWRACTESTRSPRSGRRTLADHRRLFSISGRDNPRIIFIFHAGRTSCSSAVSSF